MQVLEQTHAKHSLLTFATSLGERTCVRPLQRSIDVFAQMLGLSLGRFHGPRVGSMSSAWLRQHETEVEKHNASR